MATDDDDHDDMTMVMVLILVMVMVIYSIHSEYRNYTLNVDFRLRNSSGRATTIAAPYSSCSIDIVDPHVVICEHAMANV